MSDGNESDPQSELIRSLRNERILKSKNIEKALESIRREDFLWKNYPLSEAYVDEPLPLGGTGQTISAPHMVAIMLEELGLARGQKVLEIGSGSGYNAALLGFIVSEGTKISTQLVTTVERDQELSRFAQENIRKAGLSNVVEVVRGDGSLGYPPRANEPIYDRILVTAGAPHIPHFLEKQLKVGGILLIPVGNFSYQTLYKIRKSIKGKEGKTELTREELMACMFVPLVGEEGYRT